MKTAVINQNTFGKTSNVLKKISTVRVATSDAFLWLSFIPVLALAIYTVQVFAGLSFFWIDMSSDAVTIVMNCIALIWVVAYFFKKLKPSVPMIFSILAATVWAAKLAFIILGIVAEIYS